MPNGVGTGSPPAKFFPPRTVWQSLQLPIAASSRPCLTSAASKLCGLGGSIAAMAGRQATANAATAPPSSSTTQSAPDDCFLLHPSQRLFSGSWHNHRILADSSKSFSPPVDVLRYNNGAFRNTATGAAFHPADQDLGEEPRTWSGKLQRSQRRPKPRTRGDPGAGPRFLPLAHSNADIHEIAACRCGCNSPRGSSNDGNGLGAWASACPRS